MKLLLINKFFYMNGGSERVFFQERDYALKKGIDVIDFSMQDPRNFDSEYRKYFIPRIDYANIAGLKNKLKTSLAFIHSRQAVYKLSQLLAEVKPDIAHLHNIYHQLTPSIIPLLKRQGIKIAMTLHDGKLICPSYLMQRNGTICEECRGRKFYKTVTTHCQGSFFKETLLSAEAYYHLWKKSYDSVDFFLSPSQFMADFVSQYRLPREKVIVLKNGIDCSQYRPCDEDHSYGLFFGRLSTEKGIETLLETHASLDEPIPLKVVGSGPLEDRLKSRFTDVEFLGYQTGEALKQLIGQSSFVVVPSECYENCSMTVLESMALAKPVIGSNIGGIPEQIEDGKTGFLFEKGNRMQLAERIRQLWHHPEKRKEMGRCARRKLEREYSLEKHCDQLLSIYENLLSMNPSTPSPIE